MRPSELISCLITDCDGDNTTNYINVKSKQIVINNHKNDRNGKKVIDISTDKKHLGILRKGVGKYLITNQQGELYQSSSAFSTVFMRYFEYNVYDLRKVISSKCIQNGDVEEIKQHRITGFTPNQIQEAYENDDKEILAEAFDRELKKKNGNISQEISKKNEIW